VIPPKNHDVDAAFSPALERRARVLPELRAIVMAAR
jgi:hypothetical protein